MAGEIRITLGGDASGLVRSSEDSASALLALKKAADGTAPSITSLAPAVDKATASMHRFKDGVRAPTGELAKIGTGTDAATKALTKVSPAASAANGALLDVSRVAQDLPFGLMGIANNLTQLPQSFQRLSIAAKESGKSMGAALLSSVSGIGGLGLALSLVTSGFLIYQNGIAGFNRKTKEAKDSAEDLMKAIRDVATVQGEATASVQGQIAQVRSLASAIADSTKPYEERKRALEELKEINKSYFGDLKLESTTYSELAKRVNEYTAALVNEAITKKFIGEIANVAEAADKATTKVAKAQLELRSAQEQLATARATAPIRGTGVGQSREEAAAMERVVKATEELRLANEESTKIDEQRLVLQNRLNTSVLEGLKFKNLSTGGTKKETDVLGKQISVLEDLLKVRQDAFGKQFQRDKKGVLDLNNIEQATDRIVSLQQEIGRLKEVAQLKKANELGLSAPITNELIESIRNDIKRQINETLTRQAILLEGSVKIKVQRFEVINISQTPISSEVAKATGFDKRVPTITMPEIRINFLGFKLGNAINQAEALGEKLKEIIKDSIKPALIDISDSLGTSLAEAFNSGSIGSGLARFGESILALIGGFLQQLGTQIVLASTLFEKLKIVLSTVGLGATSLAVGLGLIAGGALLKNIKFNVPKFADGGIALGPTLGIFGEAGKEAIIPLERLPELMGNVNAAVPQVFIGNTIIKGSDLEIIFQRTQQGRARLG